MDSPARPSKHLPVHGAQAESQSPLPYPRGWYLAAFSDELEPGGVKCIPFFGQDLVVFRGQDGRVRAVDPYCPHLGTHLGHGGRVVGNALRCPAHGWCFEGDEGRCTKIPTGDPIPARAAVGVRPVREVSGLVLVWFHEAREEPTWQIDALPEFDAHPWSGWQGDELDLNAPIQTSSENDVDLEHFVRLHSFSDGRPELSSTFDGPVCRQQMRFRIRLRNMGVPLPPGWGRVGLPECTDAVVRVERFGLGIGWMRQDVRYGPFRFSFQSIMTSTPIDRGRVRFRNRHRVQRLPLATSLVRRAYVALWHNAVEEDVVIWENMRYTTRPVATRTDAPLLRFRKWAQQFYAPGRAGH